MLIEEGLDLLMAGGVVEDQAAVAGAFEQVTSDPQFATTIEAKGDEVKFLAGEALDAHLAAIYEDLSAVADSLR